MDLEAIRDLVNDWLLLLVAVLGLIASLPTAWKHIKRAVKDANLWHRIRRVEVEVDELTSVAHVHEEKGKP